MKTLFTLLLTIAVVGCASPKRVAVALPPSPPLASIAVRPLVVHPPQSRTITLTWENHFTESNQVAIVEERSDLLAGEWLRTYTGFTNRLTKQTDAAQQFYRVGIIEITNQL